MSNVLKNSRGEIDRIDHEILNLFNERMKIAREIGESKRDHNLPIENPQREREILVRLRSEAQKGLEGLTKGTLEYREAILKANESALQMLNTYKGLSYTTDAEGRIVITKGSLEDVKK